MDNFIILHVYIHFNTGLALKNFEFWLRKRGGGGRMRDEDLKK